jgi:hypothetical protein
MLAARRLLLALDLPPAALAPIGRVLRRPATGAKWFRLIHDYCYWRGVRRADAGRKLWRDVTHGLPAREQLPADDRAAPTAPLTSPPQMHDRAHQGTGR